MIEIDGSVLEGGGQILRTALSISAIKQIAIKITNICRGRSKPGLMEQHLKVGRVRLAWRQELTTVPDKTSQKKTKNKSGLMLVKDMCQAKVEGASIGSECVTFEPYKITPGTYTANIKTAGSIPLLMQVALPCCFFADGNVKLILKGGTNAEMAPQIDYLTEIFRPNLEKFGVSFDFELVRRGYFPRGGGEVIIDTTSTVCFDSINLTEQGEIVKIYGWSFVAGTLPIKLAHLMADSAKNTLQNKFPNLKIEIERYKEDHKIAHDNCSGIILVCETSTGCILGGSSLGKRNITPEDSGKNAANEIIKAVEQKACVDEHCQDQLIIFMALAKGVSRIKVGQITLHTKTTIHIIEQLLKIKFNITSLSADSHIIECTGLG